MRARDTLRLGLPLVLLLAACNAAATPTGTQGPTAAPPASATPGTSPAPSAGSSAALVLRVTTEGGFIGPAANLAALPQLSVLADGRILTPGAVDAVYPGPLVSPVSVRSIGADGLAKVVAAIRAAGLDKALPAGTGGVVADTGTTVFVVNVDGTPITNRFVLGGGGPGRPGGAGSPDPAAAAASDLLTRLQDPSETWGAATTTETTLVPMAYRIFVAPGAPVGDSSVTQASVVWPLSTALGQFGLPAVPDRGIAGLRQGVALGADATALGPLFAKATVLTPFASGGSLYTLYVRALLPDEVPAQG